MSAESEPASEPKPKPESASGSGLGSPPRSGAGSASAPGSGPESAQPDGSRRCQCRCDLWAHALYRICDPECAQAIVHAQFETADGLEWRYLCVPCWDHVRYARQSNGERVTTDLARMT